MSMDPIYWGTFNCLFLTQTFTDKRSGRASTYCEWAGVSKLVASQDVSGHNKIPVTMIPLWWFFNPMQM